MYNLKGDIIMSLNIESLHIESSKNEVYLRELYNKHKDTPEAVIKIARNPFTPIDVLCEIA